MGVLRKLWTALRGKAREVGEELVDMQAIRILEQEIRDAEEELRKAERALTTVLAKEKLQKEKVADLERSIAEYEQAALAALDKGEEALAQEIAAKIAELEAQLETERAILQDFQKTVAQLRMTVRKTKQNIQKFKQQIDTIKATEAVQKAQMAIASHHVGTQSKLQDATSTLERIRERQKLRAVELEAASELAAEESGDELKEKLKAAGILESAPSASAVLERLKQKRTPQLPDNTSESAAVLERLKQKKASS